MRKFYTLLVFALVIGAAYGQDPLIMTYEINAQIPYSELPAVSAPGVNYTVNFGDGTILANQTGPCQHTYAAAGNYTVTVTGNFGRLRYFNTNAASQLKSVDQWGDNQWTSMERAFYGCYQMEINALDVPDLSQVTNMSQAFFDTGALNQPLDAWDVSHVTNMYQTFHGASSFNQPLNSWDVSHVTNMQGMFDQCLAFNQPLNNWDTSGVTTMQMMFSNANAFNQNINDWDVSNVTDMKSMFSPATAFNQPLGDWDTSSVTTMELMFANSDHFNQPINTWDVSSVTNMTNMFNNAQVFNQPLADWDTSSVTKMEGMFGNSPVFNQPLDSWNTSNVTNMINMFRGTEVFNQPLGNWDVSHVNSMSGVFQQAAAFNQDLSAWIFKPTASFGGFVYDSALDTANYDALLNAFAQQQLQNKTLQAYGLEYCDVGVRNHLVQQLGWTITSDTPGPLCQGNTISGTVHYNEDGGTCDGTDPAANFFLIGATDGGNPTHITSAGPNGNFELTLPEGTYTTSLLNVPDYFSVSPQQPNTVFTGVGNEATVNFCISPAMNVADLNVTLIPKNVARPGFAAQYRLVVRNIGTQTVNASAVLSFDNTKQLFASANPAASAVASNQLTFDLQNLQSFGSRTFDLTFSIAVPPTVNGGDQLTLTASVTPNANDLTPQDNQFTLLQPVLNSFDPNDKTVLQGAEVDIDDADQYLDYVIRFQNTGSASAVNVRLRDVLDAKLDANTFTPLTASDDYTVNIADGRVEILFDNINLPHESADEPGSHGFFAYKIKPVAGVNAGDVVSGNASIYFDYNAPIVTNDVHTTFVTELAVDTPNLALLSLYPNPADGLVHLKVASGVTIREVTVYNVIGNKVRSFTQSLETIDVSGLSPGVYLLSAKTDKGRVQTRLLKK